MPLMEYDRVVKHDDPDVVEGTRDIDARARLNACRATVTPSGLTVFGYEGLFGEAPHARVGGARVTLFCQAPWEQVWTRASPLLHRW